MVPAATIEKIGATIAASYGASFNKSEGYVLDGNDMNDLSILVARLNYRLEGDELRDWQNRIALMLSNAITLSGSVR